MMQIKKLPKSQIEFEITVAANELENFMDLAAEELSKEMKIDGFRPGKAPRNIVEQKIGSEKMLAHGAEKAIKKNYVDSIVKNRIEAVGEPKITITKIARGNDLVFKALVAVVPKIKLSEYRKIAKSAKRPEKKSVKASQIEKEIEALQKSRAKIVTVSREARKGDLVEIDFDVFVDGKLIEGGSSRNHPLTIGESYFIPGFEDNLCGMKSGDEKEFELKFPEDYHQKDLSGKPAHFKVKINLVQEKDLPTVNDDFAKSLGNFDNLEKLKQSIAEGLEMEQQKKNSEKWRTELIEKIAAESQFDVPEVLIENELEKMTGEFEQNIAGMGLKLDTYLQNIKKSKEELLKSWREPAEKRVRAALILREIASAEEISVSAAEIEEEMNRIMAYYKNIPEMEKKVDMERLYDYTKGILTNEKVLKFLESL